jgi:predicted PurR-regulated permease PerM
MENSNKQNLDISFAQILRIVLIGLGIVFLWFIRDILLLLLISWVFVTILHPVIERLHRNGVPRVVGVSLLYIMLGVLLFLIVALIAPPLAEQIKQLINHWPSYIERFTPVYNTLSDYAHTLGFNTNSAQNIIKPLTGSVYGFTLNFISSFFSMVIVLVISFYVLIEEQAVKRFWISLVPTDKKSYAIEVLNKISLRWGGWIRGRLTVALSIGILTYIALLLIGVPFALTLAVIMSLMDFIPFIGPMLAFVPIFVVAYSTGGWLMVILAGIAMLLIQQLEAYILEPKIMQKNVGLSPVIVIVSIMIGAKMAGVVGIILAIPVAAGISSLFQEWKKFKESS